MALGPPSHHGNQACGVADAGEVRPGPLKVRADAAHQMDPIRHDVHFPSFLDLSPGSRWLNRSQTARSSARPMSRSRPGVNHSGPGCGPLLRPHDDPSLFLNLFHLEVAWTEIVGAVESHFPNYRVNLVSPEPLRG